MKLMFVLTIISWLKPLRQFVESAPHKHLIDQLSSKTSNLVGFPDNLSSELPRKLIVRNLGAIVFEEQTKTSRDMGVIHFPVDDDDDDEVDLSGSFKPSKNSNLPPPGHSGAATFANCGGFSQSGVYVSTSSNSGIFTYPNGTKVSYSKCVIVQTIE